MSSELTDLLRQKRNGLAERIVELQYARQGQLWDPYGVPGQAKSLRDAGYHLDYLAEALDAHDPVLFDEYLAWVKVLFTGLKFPQVVLPETLECTRQVLVEQLPAGSLHPALELIRQGLDNLALAPSTLPTNLTGESMLDCLARDYLEALLSANRQQASRLVLDAVEKGVSIKSIYTQVFQRTQREIGRLWQTNQISVAQEHFCTAATQMIMSQLYPYMFTGERKDRHMVVACVGGELHEIGARMVADFLEMEGWDTYFLGANTPPESIIHTVHERKADVLAISATMTFHVSKVSGIISDLRRSEGASHTRVLVGGYPFNLSPGLWQHVGADAYAPDAEAAIQAADRILVK